MLANIPGSNRVVGVVRIQQADPHLFPDEPYRHPGSGGHIRVRLPALFGCPSSHFRNRLPHEVAGNDGETPYELPCNTFPPAVVHPILPEKRAFQSGIAASTWEDAGMTPGVSLGQRRVGTGQPSRKHGTGSGTGEHPFHSNATGCLSVVGWLRLFSTEFWKWFWDHYWQAQESSCPACFVPTVDQFLRPNSAGNFGFPPRSCFPQTGVLCCRWGIAC